MTALPSAAVLDVLPQAALDVLPSPVFLATVPEGRILRSNQRAAELCRDRHVDTGLCELLHGVQAEDAGQDPIVNAIQQGSRLEDVEAVLEVAGQRVAVAVSIEPLFDAADRVVATLTICHVIERWKHAEQAATALRRSEQRLQLALAAGRLGSWEFDLRTGTLTSSVQCKANHGLAPDADLQLETNLIPAIAPEHRDRFRAAIDRAITEQGSFEIEVPHRWPDGSDHWLLVAGRVIEPNWLAGVSLDITARRRIELALRDSERQYREIVETANEGIWTLDENGAVTFVNQRMADLIGYPAEAMIGRRKWDFVFPDDVPAMKALFEKRRQGVGEDLWDIRFRHRDGREIWTLMAARPKVDGAGRFIGALDLFTDITERRRTEQALRESEDRFRTLADSIPQLAWMADREGRIFWYNRRWLEYTGRSLDEMRGWGWQAVHHPDHVEAVVEKIRRCFDTGHIWEDTFPLLGKDGTYRWFLSRAVPLRDEHGTVTRWFGTNTDVTEARRAEEALRDADRQKDEFISVLAHELRGPLAPILTAVRLLEMKGPADPELQKLRATIRRQTVQLSKLVDDLLDVGRITAGKLRLEKTPVELKTLLEQAAETCAPLIERRRHTLTLVCDTPVRVDVDAGRIVQVVSNLLSNAAKYMQEGGRITLSGFQQDETAVIRVQDEGVGIPPEMLDRVFQRFVQIKSSAHRAEGGLGIGLSLVRALVELHGGSVAVQSDGVGSGSTFTVRLPAIPSTWLPEVRRNISQKVSQK